MLLSEVKGKDITELIAAGREKLASVPSGGGGVAVAAAAGGAAPAAAAAAEPKKEEKVEEKEESDDVSSFIQWLFLVQYLCVNFILFNDMFFECCITFCRIWDSVYLTRKDYDQKCLFS